MLDRIAGGMGLRYALIAFGSAGTALSLEICYIPHHLLDGGMTGAGVVFARLIGWPPVIVLFAGNLICLALGFRILGRPFMVRTALGTLTMATILYLVGPLAPLLSPQPSAVLGGLGVGLGTALVLGAGGALDGSDVMGQILQHAKVLSLCHFLLAVNVCLFVVVILLYGLTSAMLSVVGQGVVQATLFFLVPRVQRRLT